MCIAITIDETGKSYDMPKTWKDITLSKFIAYLRDVQPKTPKFLYDVLHCESDAKADAMWDSLDTLTYAKEILPFLCEYICFWGDMEMETAVMLNKNQVLGLWFSIELLLYTSPNDSERRHFEFSGQTYYFPQTHMKDSSVIEFVEASQYEHLVGELAADKWEVMTKIIAILCRKRGEKYQMNEKWLNIRSKLFEGLSMDIVLDVAFFLQAQSKKSAQETLIYMLAQKLAISRQT